MLNQHEILINTYSLKLLRLLLYSFLYLDFDDACNRPEIICFVFLIKLSVFKDLLLFSYWLYPCKYDYLDAEYLF